MKKRMNIALCVAMIENAFTYSIIDGAMIGAKDIDANLYILPVGIVNAQYDNCGANFYRYQYNTLCSLIDEKSIDVVVLEYGTVTSFLSEAEKSEFLSQFGDIPVVLVAGDYGNYSSVCVDNRTGLCEIITHLYEEKHCTKIGFVSGPKTSQDAIERLDVYRSMVEKYQLPLGEDWIVYGNFSEFSEGVVEELLERHPDIEAIVCANDQMASGCYNTLKKHQLKPGTDIYVTGFDDSSVCMLLEPHLTSVKADTKELGYLAVKECERVVKGEVVHSAISTKMIVRESVAGDMSEDIVLEEYHKVQDDENYIQNFADETYKKYFYNFFESKESARMKDIVNRFFDFFFGLVDADGQLCLEHKPFMRAYQEFEITYEKGYVGMDDFISIIYMLYHCISHKISSERDRLALVEEISNMNQLFISNITKQQLANEEKTKLFEVSLTNITRDMLQNADSDEEKYATVLEKLKVMGFLSSYIYLFDEPVTHHREDVWVRKPQVYVSAYYNDDQVEFFPRNTKAIATDTLFVSDILPKDRQVNMLVMPLFSSSEQYGLIFTESSLEYFRYASQIICQVGVSMDVLNIIDRQNEIKNALERNLALMEENNKVLDAMSHTDSLTGICNRRGYEDKVKSILTDPDNYGKRAIALYADMDCLKIVNDEFGHDEGDFSLKTIADTLRESLQSNAVVARMGGDEFAAFSFVQSDHFSEKVKKRIRSILMEKNVNDKPYYVNMSIGTCEFVIDEFSDLDAILGYADEELYKEKKSKIKVVYKEKI
ncbi:MAG: diguanylate cyclase domain-containing protein [Lachnospiraceae bacterium]